MQLHAESAFLPRQSYPAVLIPAQCYYAPQGNFPVLPAHFDNRLTLLQFFSFSARHYPDYSLLVGIWAVDQVLCENILLPLPTGFALAKYCLEYYSSRHLKHLIPANADNSSRHLPDNPAQTMHCHNYYKNLPVLGLLQWLSQNIHLPFRIGGFAHK